MAKALAQYEAMFLLAPSGSTEPQAALDLCRSIIEKHEGQILVIKKWDERKLTYEISGQKRGLFIIAFFRAPGGSITAIERDVNLSEQVLRILVTRADHLNEQEMAAVEPQPIQPREERGNPMDRPHSADAEGRPPRHDRGDRSDRPARKSREETAEVAADKE